MYFCLRQGTRERMKLLVQRILSGIGKRMVFWETIQCDVQLLEMHLPDVTPHIYGHLIFDKVQNYTMEKKKASPISGASLTGCWHVEECK